ncbi:MAG: TonB-dependent receptor [Bacteroidota bacterium]
MNFTLANRLLSTLLLLFVTMAVYAQVTITGTVLDDRSGLPLPGATVEISTVITLTNTEGEFKLSVNLEEGVVATLTIHEEGHQDITQAVTIGSSPTIDLGTITMKTGDDLTNDLAQELLPTISITDLADEDGSGARTVSSLLGANRDPFVNAAAFNWGVARFRIRGYDAEYSDFYLNNLPFNDLESGRIFFGQWGGLNRVTNNRTANVGISAVDYGFNGIGGGSSMDLRARSQRKQTRIGYAMSNRTYRNRLMGVHSSGLSEKGWAYSVSGSYRWADEGFVEGTPYEAYSYFLSVDKVFDDGHALSFTGLGSPSKRGSSFPAVQEMNDIVGTNYYNANWGFQNGEKRNSRVSNYHQPILMLRHDYDPNPNFNLSTTVGFQFGRGGRTSLDWFDAPDPRPDYYRYLPSFVEDPELAERVRQNIANNVSLQQINWDNLYIANRNGLRTVENVDGIEGNDVTGLRAKYIFEDRRNDVERRIINSVFRYNPSDNATLSGGLYYSSQTTKYFKTVDDLLGADFYVDIDRFATFDSLATSDFAQNDINRPNRLLREGDRFGYDYEMHTREGRVWGQVYAQSNKIDYFFGGNVGFRKFWRNGLVQNGRFPITSLGRSPRENFFTYAFKYGATYKLNGRNFLIANAMIQEIAPNVRDAFASPRTRNQIIDDLTTQKIRSIEGGYQLRSPNVSIRFMGYFTQIMDLTSVRSFFLDSGGAGPDSDAGFINYVITGMDVRSTGLEGSVEVKLGAGLEARAVGAIGSNRITNRPFGKAFLDNFANETFENELYIKNFVVPGSPQTVGTLGLTYNSPQYWFANLNFNFFDDIYLDFFPQRRSLEAVSLTDDPRFTQQVIDPESDLFREIIDQVKAPSAFTIDFFGGKSFKINDSFIYFNLGVNNILDKRDFVTGGFEQSRFDFQTRDVDRFPPRQFYAFGRNFFVSLDYRF